MKTEILEPEKKQVLDMEISPLQRRAGALVVSSAEERLALANDIEYAKTLKENIEEKFHPTANKVAAREVYEAALDTEKQFYVPIDLFITNAKKAINGWDTSESLRIQREAREAEEKRLQEEREAKAKRDAEIRAEQEAEERRQLEEYERLEKERKAKLELQQSATENGNAKVAGIAAKEVAKIDGKIEEVKREGEEKMAQIERKAEEPLPEKVKFTPPPQPAKKLIWKARCTNVFKLCQSIAAGLVPYTLIDGVSQMELNKVAKNYDGVSKIDGLEFTQETNGRI